MRNTLRMAKWLFTPLRETLIAGCALALVFMMPGQQAALAAEQAAPAKKVASAPPAKHSASAPASRDADRAELQRILDDLHDVIASLATAGSLSAEEVYYYQRELSQIYSDLDALSVRLDSGDYGPPYGWGPDNQGWPPAADDWLPYSAASMEVSPRYAQWKGWGDRSSIKLVNGGYGELTLIINSGYYTAEWTIRDAYRGEVETKVTSQEGGDVLLTVNDDDGQHQFRLDSGGLGEIYISGRESYQPPSSGHPGYYPGQPPAADAWLQYDAASMRVSPRDAQWKGWREGSSIELAYGDYGDVTLTINSGYYTAVWTIRDAYSGQVDTEITSQQGGDVLLTVNDDDGQHQFRLDSGGLGGINIRGREGYEAPPGHYSTTKTVSPAPGSGNEPGGLWYDAYLELVDAAQIGQSREMDWFIAQTDSGNYVNTELRKLGQRLIQPESTNMRDTIGVMSYVSGSERKKMAIPNPRMSPASFITLISKAYNMTQDGKSYSFTLD